MKNRILLSSAVLLTFIPAIAQAQIFGGFFGPSSQGSDEQQVADLQLQHEREMREQHEEADHTAAVNLQETHEREEAAQPAPVKHTAHHAKKHHAKKQHHKKHHAKKHTKHKTAHHTAQ